MFKTFIYTLILAASAVFPSVHAQAAGYEPEIIRVNFADGRSPLDVRLNRGVTLYFDDSTMELYAGGESMSLSLGEVRSFCYVASSASVGEVSADTPRLEVSDGYIVVSGVYGESCLYVYSLGGQCVLSREFDSEVRVGLDEFSPGVYVVAVGDIRMKILIK